MTTHDVSAVPNSERTWVPGSSYRDFLCMLCVRLDTTRLRPIASRQSPLHGTKMRGVRSPGKIASKKHGRGVLTSEVRPPPRPVLGVRALSRHRTRRARPHTMSPPNAPAPFTTRPVPSPSTSPQAASAPYACAGPCAGVGCPWARSLTPYHFINTPPVTPSPG